MSDQGLCVRNIEEISFTAPLLRTTGQARFTVILDSKIASLMTIVMGFGSIRTIHSSLSVAGYQGRQLIPGNGAWQL